MVRSVVIWLVLTSVAWGEPPRGQADTSDVFWASTAGTTIGLILGVAVGLHLGGTRDDGEGLNETYGAALGGYVGLVAGASIGIATYESVTGHDGSVMLAASGAMLGGFVGPIVGGLTCFAGPVCILTAPAGAIMGPSGLATAAYVGTTRPKVRRRRRVSEPAVQWAPPSVGVTQRDGVPFYSLTLASGTF